jgi:hypothetical protein
LNRNCPWSYRSYPISRRPHSFRYPDPESWQKAEEVVEPDDLDIAINAKLIVATLSNLAPESARKGIAVKSVDELVKALTTEALSEVMTWQEL